MHIPWNTLTPAERTVLRRAVQDQEDLIRSVGLEVYYSPEEGMSGDTDDYEKARRALKRSVGLD